MRVEREVVPDLRHRIDEHVSSIYGDLSKEELYQTPRDYVDAIRGAFQERADIINICESAEEYIAENAYDDEDEYASPATTSRLAAPESPTAPDVPGSRDPFEDVAAGH